jgi:hypothetical protein
MSEAPREDSDIPCAVDVLSGSLAAYDIRLFAIRFFAQVITFRNGKSPYTIRNSFRCTDRLKNRATS